MRVVVLVLLAVVLVIATAIHDGPSAAAILLGTFIAGSAAALWLPGGRA